jgi:hypothetical protein
MPDEAIYARRAEQLWNEGPWPLLHGARAGYGLLYPAVAGLPLAVGDFSTGYASLKLLQALVVSLAAVPVALWARRLMPPPWPLVAAALTVASPLLLYSGLVMTEVLLYPVMAVALVAVARAVETATARDQAIALAAIAAAVLTHVQAIVLVGVFAVAIAVDAAFARAPRRVLRFVPVWALLAAGGLVTLARPAVLGSYAAVAEGGYRLDDAARLTLDHTAWLIVATGVAPAAALALLVVDAARGRERDPPARAFVAVASSAVVLGVVEVGVFASEFAPHLLERDLAALPPVLFLALTLWIARGAPRPWVATTVVAIAVLAPVVAVRWRDLVDPDAIPDSFTLTLLWRVREHDVATIVAAVAAAMLALLAFVPRRARLVLPALVLVGSVGASVVATDEVARLVRYDQNRLVGKPRDWIDVATGGRPAVYLYDNEPYWNVVWHALAWNSSLKRVASVGPSRVPGPLQQQEVRPDAIGLLHLPERFLVATSAHAFRGEAIAGFGSALDVGVTQLWQLDPPARLSTVTSGVLPNGDMIEPAHLLVYDCAGGRLELTLLPKATDILTIALDGRVALRTRIAGLGSWRGGVDVPPSRIPRVCRFTIEGGELLGSTRIEFVRR